MEQHAIFDVPLDSSRKDEALHVCTDPLEFACGLAMRHLHDVLFDDWTFVEIFGGVMRLGTDELDAAVKRSLRGVRSDERR